MTCKRMLALNGWKLQSEESTRVDNKQKDTRRTDTKADNKPTKAYFLYGDKRLKNRDYDKSGLSLSPNTNIWKHKAKIYNWILYIIMSFKFLLLLFQ